MSKGRPSQRWCFPSDTDPGVSDRFQELIAIKTINTLTDHETRSTLRMQPPHLDGVFHHSRELDGYSPCMGVLRRRSVFETSLPISSHELSLGPASLIRHRRVFGKTSHIPHIICSKLFFLPSYAVNGSRDPFCPGKTPVARFDGPEAVF